MSNQILVVKKKKKVERKDEEIVEQAKAFYNGFFMKGKCLDCGEEGFIDKFAGRCQSCIEKYVANNKNLRELNNDS